MSPCSLYDACRGKSLEKRAAQGRCLTGLPNECTPQEDYDTDLPEYQGQAHVETGFGSERLYKRYVKARDDGQWMEKEDQAVELEKA